MKDLSLPIALFLSLLFLACPKPSDNKPPEKADCDPGFLPCEEDSTICCEVICPPGTILGGQDSTECIPVECPPDYHLCGPDSTDCCLDTTSHAMIWDVDTIFTGLVNWAMDVAIIDDTTIWVVGDFELDDPEDTLTSFEERFNLIRWNGINWVLDRILSTDGSQAPTLYSIYVLNENDIWVGSTIPRHWDGMDWTMYNQDNGWIDFGSQITAIWASGPDDVFFVSINGQINHWDGSGFTRMETPTDIQLADIGGTGPNDVWAVGYDVSIAKTTLIYYNGAEWSLKYEGDIIDWFGHKENSLSGVIKAVQAFTPGTVHVLSNSNGIYTTSVDSVPRAVLLPIDPAWQGMIKMRGNHSNDLYISGNHSGIAHYNGESVYRYPLGGELVFWDLDVKNDLVVAISRGENTPTVIAYIGHKE